MDSRDKLFINHGNLSLTDADELPPFEIATIKNMEEAGFPDTQLVTTDPSDVAISQSKGFGYAIDPFRRRNRGKGYLGVLDTTGGTTVADKACRFALYKAQSLGVKTVLDPEAGCLESFVTSSDGKVTGIRTRDGREHRAARIIVACGGWTPSLVPALDAVCETTCGSVAMMKIPKGTPLFERLAPHNFPSWTYKVRDGAEGGLYGFAVNEEGYLKIGYRGEKWTNPRVQNDDKERSVPVTRYTSDEQRTQIPAQALRVIKAFIDDFLPELGENGIKIDMTRLCWYNDSWDNHYVIDYVPGQEYLMVATAGSGHAFKYLPNIGRWIVDIMEGRDLDRQLVRSWRWRQPPEDGVGIVNQLMEGTGGRRVLSKAKMSVDMDMQLGSDPAI